MPKLMISALLMMVLGTVLLVVPSIVFAGGPTLPSNPPPPAPHRHFIQEPDGTLLPVGPDWCDNLDDPAIALAFYHFHYNVHLGADGLHDLQGAEVTARGCSFHP